MDTSTDDGHRRMACSSQLRWSSEKRRDLAALCHGRKWKRNFYLIISDSEAREGLESQLLMNPCTSETCRMMGFLHQVGLEQGPSLKSLENCISESLL